MEQCEVEESKLQEIRSRAWKPRKVFAWGRFLHFFLLGRIGAGWGGVGKKKGKTKKTRNDGENWDLLKILF